MRTKMLFLTLIIFAIVLGGCQPVLVRQPVGVPVSEDISKTFDGVWQTSDGKYIFFVKSKPNGILDVAGIEMQNGHFVVRDTTCIVTRLGEWMYLNVPVPADSTGKRSFLFAPILTDQDRDLIAFMPNYDFFKKAIDKNEIKGISVGEYPHIEIENPKQQFFESKIGGIVQSSQFVMLKRTRQAVGSDAWPMEK
jgi:hypothetical protein